MSKSFSNLPRSIPGFIAGLSGPAKASVAAPARIAVDLRSMMAVVMKYWSETERLKSLMDEFTSLLWSRTSLFILDLDRPGGAHSDARATDFY